MFFRKIQKKIIFKFKFRYFLMTHAKVSECQIKNNLSFTDFFASIYSLVCKTLPLKIADKGRWGVEEPWIRDAFTDQRTNSLILESTEVILKALLEICSGFVSRGDFTSFWKYGIVFSSGRWGFFWAGWEYLQRSWFQKRMAFSA